MQDHEGHHHDHDHDQDHSEPGHDHGGQVQEAHDHDAHDHPAHAHEGHGHDHSHDLRSVSRRMLWWALIINFIFLVVEVAGGLISNSLALLADAGHMLTDVAALVLALVVSYLASRPATGERTYGLLRAEVLGAFVNGATLVLIVGLILREAWIRIGHPEPIEGPLMLGIAVAGLIANLVSAWILAGGRKDNINVEGAFLHMIADALGSVGAIIAGVVIWVWNWTLIDPIASAVISIFILWSSWGLLRQTIGILLESTPPNIKFDEVKQALENMEHVDAIHDLHIWTISSGVPVLSAHLSLSECCCDTNHWQECLANARQMLLDRFQIHHTTLQVEPANSSCSGECKLGE